MYRSSRATTSTDTESLNSPLLRNSIDGSSKKSFEEEDESLLKIKSKWGEMEDALKELEGKELEGSADEKLVLNTATKTSHAHLLDPSIEKAYERIRSKILKRENFQNPISSEGKQDIEHCRAFVEAVEEIKK